MSYVRPVSITVALLAIGCARQQSALARAPGALSVDHSLFCERVADRFVGLPALGDRGDNGSRVTPLVGRWWLRGCSATHGKSELRVRLQGPGWYFVDTNDGDLSIQQQVPFNLSIELDGHVNMAISEGIVSLWFMPNREPLVDLQVSSDLDVRPSSTWGTVLSMVPFVSLPAVAAERFTKTASDAFRLKLRDGATLTYDMGANQADAAVGKLDAGRSPPNAFHDRVPWLISDRLSLAGAALHVVGPIDPGPTTLDVTVERGAGVAYRALCVGDMGRDYPALARGNAAGVRKVPSLASGTIAGQGQHRTEFRIDECKFYLVISALTSVPTIVSVRVRA
jgi:hypothetical protein